MVIRNKEYYNQLDAEVKNDLRTLNYHRPKGISIFTNLQKGVLDYML